MAGCKYIVLLGFLVHDTFRERAARVGWDGTDAPLTREPTIVSACASDRARTRIVVACGRCLMPIASYLRCGNARLALRRGGIRLATKLSIPAISIAPGVHVGRKIMKRVVVCLAPAVAVEGFLGFLNTLNIAGAEVT